MPWLIDGSNVLGASGRDVRNDQAKREFVGVLAAFARARRTRVTCLFDGEPPAAFPTHLGSVTIAFSGPRPADDVIVQRASTGHGWIVVTSDLALANRVRRRSVEVQSSLQFLRALEELQSEGREGGSDWEAYFSDPKNRHDF